MYEEYVPGIRIATSLYNTHFLLVVLLDIYTVQSENWVYYYYYYTRTYIVVVERTERRRESAAFSKNQLLKNGMKTSRKMYVSPSIR